jgi:hypothetical protein
LVPAASVPSRARRRPSRSTPVVPARAVRPRHAKPDPAIGD